jgi:hypothetical protein
VGAGAFALGTWFRRFSMGALVVFLASASVTFLYAPQIAAQEPTPYLGLAERGMFAVFFGWMVVLAMALWRERISPS